MPAPTPVYTPDKQKMIGFIMVEYDEPVMRVILPDSTERMPTAQELLDRTPHRPLIGVKIAELEIGFLNSQRLIDCGAEFITNIWICHTDPDWLLHLPRELFQTVPEVFGLCRRAAQRN